MFGTTPTNGLDTTYGKLNYTAKEVGGLASIT